MQTIVKTGSVLLLVAVGYGLPAQSLVVEQPLHHLRAGDEPEWNRFRGSAEKQLTVRFSARKNNVEQTLSLRQEDVRLGWSVTLNGQELGRLDPDESARICYLPVRPNTLVEGENTLTIAYTKPFGRTDPLPDDIRVGAISLFDRPTDRLLGEARVELTVTERKTGRPLPVRITVADPNGALQPLRALPNQTLAVRTGVLYTGDGKAAFSLPAGRYTVYAGRGTEYGVDSLTLNLKAGDAVRHRLQIEKEVPTDGWIAADPHIHTFSYSRHGDATVQERVLSIAGEGLELPILTDHNVAVDIAPVAAEMKLNAWFTAVTGNEFTTEVGHFNVFPVSPSAPVPDHRVKDWPAAARNLDGNGRVIILNHARDKHYDFIPFGPKRYVSEAGLDRQGWNLPANAMEVINSSAQQKDILQLFRDWFGVLNRGRLLTPVGSSDSHDVGRYLVGQGRTYIRYPDGQPGRIDVDRAVDQFLAGRVMVSFGLMAELTIDRRFGPGDLVPAAGEVRTSVRVLGPSWLKADRVSLYANGLKIREAVISKPGRNGVQWEGSWTIPVGRQDVWLVAVAEGPGVSRPFWAVPNPYQRVSAEWNPRLIGASGAVWIDADGDGRKTAAYTYALQLVEASKDDFRQLFDRLAGFDEAVIVQTAAVLQERNRLREPACRQALEQAPARVQAGFTRFKAAWEAAD
ncbi:CehA/McbA family metallohydrolase [Larkinella soli]|uniref:CehA/McbA family metallohydrolase n=1 Tax=Larkinella soli TaxID=1770527 RepID=UPI000FFCA26C|nr:CehA/McbA family metallohydrolase [Larkinella soli]